MKKTILALTIPALFATSANAATVYSAEDGTQVDVYGRIQYDIGELNGADNEDIGGDGSARLGVNVKYNLNQDVDLIGKLEWQVTAETANDANTQDINSRYAWAGFRFMDTTDLTFGKSENPYVQLSDFTDIFELGGAAAYDHGFRIDDQVRVSYADQGFDLRAAYAFADENRLSDAVGTPENQYSLSAGYALAAGPGDLGLAAAYEQINFNGGDLDKWGLGVNYAIDGFYFGVTYGQSDQTTTLDADQWEAVGTYTVDAWTLGLGFNFKKADSDIVGPRVLVEDYILAAKYALNAKTKLYGEYYIDETVNANDRYGVGIQYNF
ncbi:porin [Zobellella endophytica]|uniref:Porin n=1 Tax=Zobellella endophytica TaxID=2116700 RepID=A0A2P7RCM1_9GAMM|nr:porin [Zobellella endophytica]PSJ47971.1 porin [Zobellella endophytica]